MYIEWLVTDDISGMDLEEFFSADEMIYGHIKTTLFDPPLGFIPREINVSTEGNSDIVHWMFSLIKVCNSVCDDSTIEIRLMSYDMLKILITCEEKVSVSLINTTDNHPISIKQMARNEVYDVIIQTVDSFFEYMRKENSTLLDSPKMKKLLLDLEILKARLEYTT